MKYRGHLKFGGSLSGGLMLPSKTQSLCLSWGRLRFLMVSTWLQRFQASQPQNTLSRREYFSPQDHKAFSEPVGMAKVIGDADWLKQMRVHPWSCGSDQLLGRCFSRP